MNATPTPDPRPTVLLQQLARGDRKAEAPLWELLYGELRSIAAHQLGAKVQQHTLSPTALLHEAWIRLIRQEGLSIQCRAQFFALASRVMRSVLVDHARARAAERRGGDRTRITLTDVAQATPRADVDLLALDEALGRLQSFDPELCRVVELRFFGGLTNSEVAEALGTSLRTVERSWQLARAWLHAELSA